ncbi:hypothetical protein D3C78_1475700 [compost metagenome]
MLHPLVLVAQLGRLLDHPTPRLFGELHRGRAIEHQGDGGLGDASRSGDGTHGYAFLVHRYGH